MARPRRESDWAPITARLSVDAARRLRVAAARRGTTQGKILDELILRALPPADPLPSPPPMTSLSGLTIEALRRGMERQGFNQSDVARALGITPKAVSEWFERGQVPPQRWPALRRLLDKPSRPQR